MEVSYCNIIKSIYDKLLAIRILSGKTTESVYFTISKRKRALVFSTQ